MDGMYDMLFKELKFGNVRNAIFEKLNSDIEAFIFEKKYNGLNDFFSKFKEYIKLNPEIIYFNFKFVIRGNIIYFFHPDYAKLIFKITILKKFQISLNSDGSDAKNEWIFNNDYLMYLIYKIYKMKNPKFAHRVESIKDESSIISLKEDNIIDYLQNDWNTIYEANEQIDFKNILEKRNKIFEDKTKDYFFIQLIGIKDIKEIPKDFFEYKNFCSSFDEIFLSYNLANYKNIIFHNEDIYFRFNLFQHLEMYYDAGVYGNFYINFKLLRESKRHEKLERIAYFLSFLFPEDYPNLNKFFEEKIKYKISDDLYCWKEIIFEIINYFQNNIFKKKKEGEKIETSEPNDKLKTSNKKIHLFNEIEKKKFFIIFDDISTYEENIVVKNIINEFYNPNFTFFIIYPLINLFTSNKLIEYVNNPYDSFSPFSLLFANIINFNSRSPNYFETKEEKIFTDINDNDEIIFYDLIRIFNFKSIFVESINSDINSKSLGFLTKYINYLNIEFDNKNKKIINISFKNKSIEDEFKKRYENTLTIIKTQNTFSFNNIIGQRDGFDLEKIIISEMVYNQRNNFEILEVKSIFGLKELEKKEEFDYINSNFFIKQKSSNAEMFDFAFKIIKDNKQYFKITQITSTKTKDEKKKLSIEKIKISCSYLRNEFKKNGLGDIDGFSFCIIFPLTILKDNDKKNYKDLKKFCRENNYEFLLFDLKNKSFCKKIKEKYFQKDVFEIDIKHQLNIDDFNTIININAPLTILSLRKVKNGMEDLEDLNAEQKAKNYITQSIERIAKFEFTGKFTDIKRLKENYFAYIYLKKEISIYFYKDTIIKNDENLNYNNYSNKKLYLILYSAKEINEDYLDSSPESENDEIKEDKQKIAKNQSIEKKRKNETKRIKKKKKQKEEEIGIDENKEEPQIEGNDKEQQKILNERGEKFQVGKKRKSAKRIGTQNKEKFNEKNNRMLDVNKLSINCDEIENKNEEKVFLGQKTKSQKFDY